MDTMNNQCALHLFECFGVELEYMIVDADTLDVLPICDRLFRTVAGSVESDIELDELIWSNELVQHVVELKTNGPASSLEGLHTIFQAHIEKINDLLRPSNARLLPTAMHPWMDPERETTLWRYDNNIIYETFNRIFDCRGHGWSNLQSAHLNLPFAGDDEFGRLHAAIRLVLPLIPAVAASSPIYQNHINGCLDNRMEFYRWNSVKIPSITGHVIPEPIFTIDEYRQSILHRIYRDISPYDPEKVLRHEWLNARGAIARFSRNTIEIRILDIQECPLADLSIAWMLVKLIQGFVNETWSSYTRQKLLDERSLEAILIDTIHQGEHAVIQDRNYLELFSLSSLRSCNAGELWRFIAEQLLGPALSENELYYRTFIRILEHGSLSSRIVRALDKDRSKESIAETYRSLAACLHQGDLFHVD